MYSLLASYMYVFSGSFFSSLFCEEFQPTFQRFACEGARRNINEKCVLLNSKRMATTVLAVSLTFIVRFFSLANRKSTKNTKMRHITKHAINHLERVSHLRSEAHWRASFESHSLASCKNTVTCVTRSEFPSIN